MADRPIVRDGAVPSLERMARAAEAANTAMTLVKKGPVRRAMRGPEWSPPPAWREINDGTDAADWEAWADWEQWEEWKRRYGYC